MRRWIIAAIVMSCSTLAGAEGLAEFTKSMEHKSGFYDIYYDAKTGNVYVKVDKFEQPFIFLNSLPQGIGSNDIGLDRGQLGETRIVQFERYGEKVMLKQLNTYYRANSNNAAERESIDEAFADSVIAGFKVAAEDDDSVLIDYTKYLLSDVHQVSETLSNRKQGSYKVDASRSAVYMKRTKAFPKNTEMEAMLTYTGSKPGQYVNQVTPAPKAITVHSHHSFVQLPDDNYQPREYHPYSGYWKIEHMDYATAIEESMFKRYIPRHRLEKKNPNAAISEAVEPIIYYLDPGVPEPVKGALLDGARWWAKAFEDIGFKDGYQVKILPADADPMDVRYNVIQWVHRATRGWSYGGSVIDPRTGEILKGHVTLGSLRVRQDYLIALGLTSPFTGGNTDTSAQKEMALARIRQLSAHEVGHTLGIAHNFSASVNNRASVMDYPQPLVTLNNGRMNLDNAYDVGMGQWDSHVVAYGYSDFADGTNEEQALQGILAAAKAKGLKYTSDPDARPRGGANAFGHLWDNGQNPVTELKRMSEVRKVALQNFGLDSMADGSSLSNLEEALAPIYYYHRFQVEAVAKLIAGMDYEYQLKSADTQKGYSLVDSKTQKAAINALLDTLNVSFLKIPKNIVDLIPPKTYGESRNRESFNGRTGVAFDVVAAAEASANQTVSMLLHPQRLNRLQQHAAYDQSIPSLSTLLDMLFYRSLNGQQYSGLEKMIHQRVNVVIIENLMSLLTGNDADSEVKAVLFSQLMKLEKSLKKKAGDGGEYAGHYMMIAKALEWYFHHGKWQPLLDIKAMPPGSPI